MWHTTGGEKSSDKEADSFVQGDGESILGEGRVEKLLPHSEHVH